VVAIFVAVSHSVVFYRLVTFTRWRDNSGSRILLMWWPLLSTATLCPLDTKQVFNWRQWLTLPTQAQTGRRRRLVILYVEILDYTCSLLVMFKWEFVYRWNIANSSRRQ